MTGLLAWGVALPENEYHNEELGRLLGIPPERTVRYGQLLGIHRRRSAYDIKLKRQTIACHELATAAAAQAISQAGIHACDLDVVIATSSCFDYFFPSVSSRMLKGLSIPRARTFDLMGGCAEFLHGVALADALLQSGEASCILVSASEVITSLHLQVRFPLDYFLFGDAGAAVILTRDRGEFRLVRRWLDTRSTFEGVPLDPVIAPLLGGKAPGPLFLSRSDTSPWVGNAVPPEYRLVHDARMATRIAVPFMSEAVHRVIGPSGVTPGDYFLVPHQPAVPLVTALGDALGLNADQVGVTSSYRGNMSTASVPVTFADHLEQIRRHRYHVWVSIGAGVSLGAILWERTGGATPEQPHTPAEGLA